MINIELSPEQAIHVLLLIDREQALYATDATCPARVAQLREVSALLDSALDSAPSCVEAE